jgi:hypothetical protein
MKVDTRGISVIRRADARDVSRVEAVAKNFCNRHDLTPINGDYQMAIEYEGDCNGNRLLMQDWKRCLCRALKVPYNLRTTIAHGHVGISI